MTVEHMNVEPFRTAETAENFVLYRFIHDHWIEINFLAT